ncbi:thermonuclease family protein [Aurantiacibacter hainanensis]|uniref:thermonuclease family protein n=1 Tax=Aurantiacibacter hainanensis TaxID=3076114 RepID=UPI0030C6E8A2
MLGAGLLVLVAYDMWRGGAAAHWTFLPWAPQANATDRDAAWFELCNGPIRYTCVVDGDTIWYRGENIRVLGIDAPEVSDPECPQEEELGERATLALRDLLNEGPFSLEDSWMEPDEDAYGRSLLRITRQGEDLGERLVHLGLAVRYRSAGPGWCSASYGQG